MRSLVMSDAETDTEWSHILGRAMRGTLAGAELKPLISDLVTWRRWRELHPETSVLNLPRTAREFTADFYKEPRHFVFGFLFQGQAYAIPMDRIREVEIANFRIGEGQFVATFDAAGTSVHIFRSDRSRSSESDENEYVGRETQSGDIHFVKLDEDRMTSDGVENAWGRTTGRALKGPEQGSQLEPVMGIMSFRRAWDNFHPDSTLLLTIP